MDRLTLIMLNLLFLTVLLHGQQLNPSHAIRPQSPHLADTACFPRPPNCDLNCPFGFRWGLGRNCVCFCQTDPCLTKSCALNEVCTVRQLSPSPSGRIVAECVSQIVSKPLIGSKVGDCPLPSGNGPCSDQCMGDSDCSGPLKCCPNGCAPILRNVQSASPTFPFFNNQNVDGIRPAVITTRVGQCPTSAAVRERKCLADCERDTDCPGVYKCCDNGCAKVCSAPEKATGCVHLAAAIDRLPSRTLSNGFVPRCSSDGRFEAVQCDTVYCWCVDAQQGVEVAGTKLFKNHARPDCSRPRDCPGVHCTNACPYGLKTLQNGCPVANCECRNICDDVRCSNAMDDCQLVEPDCQQPPCLPVPRCLLNPCPNGLPMSLPNGVTALCTHSNQCLPSHWCHTIGYNGLGFCCPQPESASRDGTCPARIPRFSDQCTSECRTDPDCRQDSKCCFDGCALKCQPATFSPLQTVGQQQTTANSIDTGLSGSSAQCPDQLPAAAIAGCRVECQSDADCAGWKRCCGDGCAKLCVYPTKATGRKKCAQSGNFEQLQCDDSSCFCVDAETGYEVTGTRSPPGQILHCPMQARHCPPIDCREACAYEWVMTNQGCPTCECRSPCTGVRCSQTQICLVIKVECFDQQKCPAQPRCVENMCPAGPPYTTQNGVVERCQMDLHCPGGFWCNDQGVSGHGVCCPAPAKAVKVGKCPPVAPLLDGKENGCTIECRSDNDCPSAIDKCCYHGCGTSCKAVTSGSPIENVQVVDRQCPAHTTVPEAVVRSCQQLCAKDHDCSEGQFCCRISCAAICTTSPVNRNCQPLRYNHLGGGAAPRQTVVEAYKLGQCATVEPRANCATTTARCVDDRQCSGVQKCCHDGCTKRCSYPKKNTACLHLKGAMEQIGVTTLLPRCSVEDGQFEPIQCADSFCYCVTRDGKEVEGTRVKKNESPNCDSRRVCPFPNCAMPTCAYGFELNEVGCAKCECRDPCKDITCPSAFHFCTVELVECTNGQNCQPVPRCQPSLCPNGLPLLNETSRQPVSCQQNGQCQQTVQPSFCRLYQRSGGYCCPSPEPRYNPGSCPVIESTNSDANCAITCQSDDNCQRSDKCCFNGCGASCVPAGPDFTAVAASPVSRKRLDQKLGECGRAEELDGGCGVRRINTCETDSDCTGIQKCCSDGCGRSCAYPFTMTACLHEKASAELINEGLEAVQEPPNRTVPSCDRDGAYQPVQSAKGFQWCVNSDGKEIQGTRTTLRSPQCHLPRPCPLFTCTRHCPHGHKVDNDGCEQCSCRDPCEGVQCPHSFQVCRLVTVDCFEQRCAPVAKCIVNACPSGEPLATVDSQVLAVCDDQQGFRCPNGHFCHRFGMASATAGYCCRGTAALSFTTEQCPVVQLISRVRDTALCQMQCRTMPDCGGRLCCFNGCGTTCRSLRNSPTATAIRPQGIRPAVTVEKLGTCPVNSISNPGCRSDCTRDSECAGFQKCCAYGCGKLCQFPRVATACIHRLAAYEEEAKKSDVTEPLELHCTPEGHFEDVQCNRLNGQCWCVDPYSGVEQVGTRQASKPNCSVPSRSCTSPCRDHSCEHGLRLDKDGCPASGLCECRNPCEELRCARANDVCILKAVACLQQPCPPIPTCRANPCMGGVDALRDQHGQVRPCSRDDDCGRGQCRQTVGDQRLSICCPKDCTKECGSDTDCDDTAKCCTYGCSQLCTTPVNATNCIHKRAAYDALRALGAVVTMHQPQCDARSGLFVSTQCNEADKCWCVDTVTGNEFYGTRSLQIHSAVNVCANRRQCAIDCDERTTVCPFGLDMNNDGCARNANCRCRNPCDEVQCPKGFVCLVRPLQCRDQSCLPMPTCERNPCIGTQQPAVEPRTYTQFTCLENRTQICPTGFYCAGYADNRQGVCCPGQEPIIDPTNSDRINRAGVCPHGDAFSNSPDGIPARCTSTSNGCPSTHYCLSKAGHLEGICCVSKRYVCNLGMDSGPCNVKVGRYYYDVDNQTCQRFDYGGCSGNLNNFATASECQKFCTGASAGDPAVGAVNDAGQLEEIFQMGFSLTGPLLREKHRSDINDAFRRYLMQRFGVDDSDIRDLTIRDDNTVRFSVQSVDAKAKAQNISNAVSNGNFLFEYRGDAYRAQPHTWFSHQVSREEAGTSVFLFWMLLISCIIFSIVVMTAICLTCSFIFRKHKPAMGSSYRSSSPSNYVPNATGYSPANSHSPQSDVTNPADDLHERRSVFSTDDIEEVRRKTSPSHSSQQHHHHHHGSLIWQDPNQQQQHLSPPQQAPAGRRRSSRTTLYY